MKIPALILTSSVLLLITTLNIANTSSNPIPFLPPIQSQSQPSDDPQYHQPQMGQNTHNQPLHTNAHKNQFDNPSPSVTSVMPF
jgi:hypothetical protein